MRLKSKKKGGWQKDHKRHSITSYGAETAPYLNVGLPYNHKTFAFAAVGATSSINPMDASPEEISKQAMEIEKRLEELSQKSTLTEAERREFFKLSRELYKLMKYAVLSDWERENYISRAKGIVANYNNQIDARIEDVGFYNIYDGSPIVSPDGDVVKVKIRLPFLTKEGNYDIKEIVAPTTAFNYLRDEQYEELLENIKDYMEQINVFRLFAEMDDRDIVFGVLERGKELIEAFKNTGGEDKDKEIVISKISFFVKALEAILNGTISEIYDELISEEIITRRPHRGIMIFEPIILMGKNPKEMEIIADGVVLHEIGHSLFTFDYRPLRPVALQILENKSEVFAELIRDIINIGEDGRLTRKLIEAGASIERGDVVNSQEYIARSLMTLAYRFHQVKTGSNPIEWIINEMAVNNPSKPYTSIDGALNIMTMMAHFNVGIDQQVIYDTLKPLIDDGVDNQLKDGQITIDTIKSKYVEATGKTPSNDKKKLIKWYKDYLLKNTPLWRFLYEKDTEGHTGYYYISKMMESNTTFEMYEYIVPLVKRLIVVYGLGKQYPPQQDDSGTGEPMPGGGMGGGGGMSGGGGSQQGEQQGGGGASGSQASEGGQQTGSDSGMGGTDETGIGEGTTSPIDPKADIKPTDEGKSPSNIPQIPITDDIGIDNGNTIGDGRVQPDIHGTATKPDGESPSQGKRGEDPIQDVKNAIDNASDDAKNDAINNIKKGLEKAAKEGQLGGLSIDDIAKELDGQTATGDIVGESGEGPEGEGKGEGKEGGEGGKAGQKSKRGGKSTGANVSRSLSNVGTGVMAGKGRVRIRNIIDRVRRGKMLERTYTERLPLAEEVFPTGSFFYIPNDAKVLGIAASYERMLDEDIQKALIEVESEPKRRGKRIYSTRLWSIITSPRTARVFGQTKTVPKITPPVNIFLLVDVSGSIDDKTWIEEMKMIKGISIAINKLKKKYSDDIFPVNFVPILFGVSTQKGTRIIDTVGITPKTSYFPKSQGGTPLDNALKYIADERSKINTLKRFRQKEHTGSTDIVIILTDGMPNNFQSVKLYSTMLNNRGAEIITAYIGGDMPKEFVEAVRPRGVIDDVDSRQLAEKTREIVKKVINKKIKQNLRKYGMV